jgi:hypothetical protein
MAERLLPYGVILEGVCPKEGRRQPACLLLSGNMAAAVMLTSGLQHEI